jgi:hypothetical protein
LPTLYSVQKPPYMIPDLLNYPPAEVSG